MAGNAAAHYSGAKQLGHGTGYKYAHNHPQHHVEQEYLPAPQTSGQHKARQAGIPEQRRYYEPTEMGFEKTIKEWLARLKKSNS